jgi:hypothetical protein
MEEGDSHERHENIFLALAAIGALALSHAGLAQCWRCVASTNLLSGICWANLLL